MRFKNILIGSTLAIVVGYLVAAFVVWDLSWISEAGSWMKSDRFGAIYVMILLTFVGGFLGSLPLFDKD